jgi:hypothetical protein
MGGVLDAQHGRLVAQKTELACGGQETELATAVEKWAARFQGISPHDDDDDVRTFGSKSPQHLRKLPLSSTCRPKTDLPAALRCVCSKRSASPHP